MGSCLFTELPDSIAACAACLPCGRSAGNCGPTATEANVLIAVEGIEQRLRELPDVNQVILAGLEVHV